ncbi:TetR/AcrR family transcriptional regulator [Duganella hordei]|uniref:TetR/AcrR family transcriptional regulator n=1 Tax=Duganella hordei TaxID=2865934 RepID=UPI00159E8F08
MKNKISNRDRILDAGLHTVHRLGFGGASVRDIVEAAGVPQGSFTNHFASKEAFGLEILDIYFGRHRELLEQTLRNDALAPLARLRAYLQANRERAVREGVENGCLFGNLMGEAIDHHEAIRLRLLEIVGDLRRALAQCLTAAVKAGELAKSVDSGPVAEFIVSGLQGATLLAKTQRSMVPMERFEQVLFGMVLGRPDLLKQGARRAGALTAA